jgi:hypothetical protein
MLYDELACTRSSSLYSHLASRYRHRRPCDIGVLLMIVAAIDILAVMVCVLSLFSSPIQISRTEVGRSITGKRIGHSHFVHQLN